jgi:hypothetical protein
MATLWTFGDSMTAGYTEGSGWADKYVEWKGYKPKIYPEIISDKLGMELKNLAKGGYDNYSIFETLCANIDKVEEDDILIFGWSSLSRIRLATKYDTWQSFVPNYQNNMLEMENISLNTLEELYVNRSSILYKNELNNWIKLINHLINNITIHWTYFVEDAECTLLDKFQRVSVETNKLINDQHYSEKGQSDLAIYLLNEIAKKSKKTNII